MRQQNVQKQQDNKALPKIGAPNDRYEREADAMADRIMRMPQRFSGQALSAGPAGIQRKCAACEQEEEQIRRQPMMGPSLGGGAAQATPVLQSQLRGSRGSGQALSPTTQGFMNRAFNTDFSHVRIHTDNRAVRMSQGLQARAFTYGSDIYFNRGEYRPESSQGKHLLGHELTHVVQQGGKQNSIQRHTLQNDPATAPTMRCPVADHSSGRPLFEINFGVNVYSLSTNDKEVLAGFANEWNLSGSRPNVRIDGYASIDGQPADNWPLSCDRAAAVANELNAPSVGGRPGIPSGSLEFFANGETDQFSSSSLVANRVATIDAPGMQPPSSREPSVFSWTARTSGSTAADNCCALCPVDLGVNSRPPGFKNSIELMASIRDHATGFSYDIKRVKEINYFRKADLPLGIAAPWTTISAWNKPAGSDDDSHNSDECLTPIQDGTTHKIYAEDTPGFTTRNFSNDYEAYIQLANFTEFVRITRPDGTTYDDPRRQNWYSKNLVEKISGTWTMNTSESDIDTGHLSSLRP